VPDDARLRAWVEKNLAHWSGGSTANVTADKRVEQVGVLVEQMYSAVRGLREGRDIACGQSHQPRWQLRIHAWVRGWHRRRHGERRRKRLASWRAELATLDQRWARASAAQRAAATAVPKAQREVEAMERRFRTLTATVPRFMLMGEVTGRSRRGIYVFGKAIALSSGLRTPGTLLSGAAMLVGAIPADFVTAQHVMARDVYFHGYMRGRNAFGGPVTANVYSHQLPKKVRPVIAREEARLRGVRRRLEYLRATAGGIASVQRDREYLQHSITKLQARGDQ